MSCSAVQLSVVESSKQMVVPGQAGSILTCKAEAILNYIYEGISSCHRQPVELLLRNTNLNLRVTSL